MPIELVCHIKGSLASIVPSTASIDWTIDPILLCGLFVPFPCEKSRYSSNQSRRKGQEVFHRNYYPDIVFLLIMYFPLQKTMLPQLWQCPQFYQHENCISICSQDNIQEMYISLCITDETINFSPQYIMPLLTANTVSYHKWRRKMWAYRLFYNFIFV